MLKGSPDQPRWIRVCRGSWVGSMFRAESWESFTSTSSAPAARAPRQAAATSRVICFCRGV